MGEKLCQALGRGNVREMPRGNFKRLDAQTLARHSALPIGSDRAVPGCHDVTRWNFVIENTQVLDLIPLEFSLEENKIGVTMATLWSRPNSDKPKLPNRLVRKTISARR
jgi:hypothetical protein